MTHTTSAELIQWMAQTVHRAHHFDSRTFWSCPQSTCWVAADHLRELRAQDERNTTTPGAIAKYIDGHAEAIEGRLAEDDQDSVKYGRHRDIGILRETANFIRDGANTREGA